MRTAIEETNLVFTHSLLNRLKTDAVVIHHIGSMIGMDVNSVDANVIHRWHLDKGWAGIAYHYVIKTNGVIQRGRPRDKIGAHALLGWNEHSIGINVVGDFETMIPTIAQKDALERLLADLFDIYKLADTTQIYGHSAVNPRQTKCPGCNLQMILPNIRGNVKILLGKGE